ncbi:TadA family conjugal transfer-associated ATPase [Cellulomonas cellasea]|uniref:TadA family conjugal transfer-associated ATPase n=1 Tax=Cellulomonas cellasea TaxID=43670 RepID=UPI0025A43C32|nr:TadA family conjugal transfer-associated ATPase [Cellulomonas cellasea]MDM8085603.1 TadA family conjugal transfer-associated ATPase [Cellulomonas cellasea]
MTALQRVAPARAEGVRGGPPAGPVARGADPVLLDGVRARLARHGPQPTDADVTEAVRSAGAVLGSRALAELGAAVRAEVLGAGPLQPLLDDPHVTDVLVNAPDQVWVEREGRLERSAVDLGTPEQVRDLAVRLAAAGGQRLDDASPSVDARLPDGARLHAVLPPVAGGCTLISLRTLRRQAFTLDELVRAGSVAPGLVPVLRALVAERANFLVTGATGTGKTTLLSALLSLVAPDQRIVCIEESGELAPDHPHVVRLLARAANIDGAGAVGLADLVRQALRMRPDRIVLGECRGAEVRDVLTALNTGHEGGCATLHANTAADVPARLEALAALAGMGRESVAAQAASALDAVVHLRRDGPRRHIAEVAVVRRDHAGELVVETAVDVTPGGLPVRGAGWEALARRLGA